MLHGVIRKRHKRHVIGGVQSGDHIKGGEFRGVEWGAAHRTRGIDHKSDVQRWALLIRIRLTLWRPHGHNEMADRVPS